LSSNPEKRRSLQRLFCPAAVLLKKRIIAKAPNEKFSSPLKGVFADCGRLTAKAEVTQIRGRFGYHPLAPASSMRPKNALLKFGSKSDAMSARDTGTYLQLPRGNTQSPMSLRCWR
jgi:hypothetical protein